MLVIGAVCGNEGDDTDLTPEHNLPVCNQQLRENL